jgi:hypothetical protein
MKIKGKIVSEGETSVELDLFEGKRLTGLTKARIREEVGEYLVEQTLAAMGEKKSPIAGAPPFPPLSKNYKKRKLQEVGSGEANLEFDGQMKDETDYKDTKDGIKIGVFGERAGAADGHNNLSGNSNLPRRQFLPDEGQTYKANISREVERIVADILSEQKGFKESDFDGVTTKKELYARLRELFGEMSRTELSLSVFRNEQLVDLLSDLDLLRLI